MKVTRLTPFECVSRRSELPRTYQLSARVGAVRTDHGPTRRQAQEEEGPCRRRRRCGRRRRARPVREAGVLPAGLSQGLGECALHSVPARGGWCGGRAQGAGAGSIRHRREGLPYPRALRPRTRPAAAAAGCLRQRRQSAAALGGGELRGVAGRGARALRRRPQPGLALRAQPRGVAAALAHARALRRRGHRR